MWAQAPDSDVHYMSSHVQSCLMKALRELRLKIHNLSEVLFSLNVRQTKNLIMKIVLLNIT